MRTIPYLIFILIIAVIFIVFFGISQSLASTSWNYTNTFEGESIGTDISSITGWAYFTQTGATTTIQNDNGSKVAKTEAWQNSAVNLLTLTDSSTHSTSSLCVDFKSDTIANNIIRLRDHPSSDYTHVFLFAGGYSELRYYDDTHTLIDTGEYFNFSDYQRICLVWDTSYNYQSLFIEDQLIYYNEITYDDANVIELFEIQCSLDIGENCYFDNITTDYLYTYTPEVSTEYQDLSDTCPDILSYPQTCFVGQDCTFWVQYNELAVAADMYLVKPETPFITDALDHIVAEYNAEFAMPFTIPYVAQATGTIEEYCVYTELLNEYDCLFGYDEFVECGYDVTWVDEAEYEANWNARMDELFDYYATTTPTMGRCEEACEEEEGFVSCGIHKGVCYLTVPSLSTMAEFETNLNAAKGEFPISTILEIQSILRGVASTSVTGITIRNPIDIVSGASTTLEISSSTITTVTGFPMYNKVYELMEWLLYMMGTGFLIIYIYKTFFIREDEI